MKTTFRFIIAAMAAISVFSSCQKELANETTSNTTDGVRTIAVQFDNSTKASLNGLKPSFENGDLIRVSNDTKSEVCTLVVSETTKFTTTLSGDLTAIYPADAAVLSSGEADAPIATSNNFKVPASQDGDVAKAIIAKATVAVGENTATFQGQTALFQIMPPTGVKSFKIESLKTVVSGARTGDAVAINTDDTDTLVITVSNTSLSTFYVALKAGVKLSDLSFEYITDVTNGLGAMKGIPVKDITAAEKTDATVANTKYTINDKNWHPYVTIDGLKWATMNIGAASATEAGTYFAWADTTGRAPSESVFDLGFTWSTCPFAISNYEVKFTKYVPSSKASEYGYGGTFSDDKTTLDLADDAANAKWGGSWRMPTQEEFNNLNTITEWDDTNKGCKFGTSPNQIFLPAAGYGSENSLENAGSFGYYWSSSLSTDEPDNACRLSFRSGLVGTNVQSRYYGRTVRALSD